MLFTIFLIAFVTALTRFLPFFIFRRHTPKFISRLGVLLPASLLSLVFIYSCKDIILDFKGEYLQAIGILIVLALHIIFKKILLSILGGTLIYLIIQNHTLILKSIESRF